MKRANLFDKYKIVDSTSNSSYMVNLYKLCTGSRHLVCTIDYNTSCCGAFNVHNIRAHEDVVEQLGGIDNFFQELWNYLSDAPKCSLPVMYTDNVLGCRRSMCNMTFPVTGNDDGTATMQGFIKWVYDKYPEVLSISTPTYNPNSGRWIVTATLALGEPLPEGKETSIDWFK